MERVYVANLPPDIRIKDIDDFFRPFGKLVYIDVNHRSNPVSAHVQFDNARNAFNAVKARHGYDYEGYTLQMRLVENEVRRRRDATPPPPPPPMFNGFDRQNMNGNNYGSNRMMQNYSVNSSSSQWPNVNRSKMEPFETANRPHMRQQNMGFSSNCTNMQQLTMMPYSTGSHSNMEQQFPNTGRSNMQEQLSNANRQNQYSNASRSNMQQQYSNFSRSNIQQQYPSISHSNMAHSSNFNDRPGMQQQNMPYSSSGPLNTQQQLTNTSRPNIPQLQNLNIHCPDNNSWGTKNNSMGWNDGNFGNDFNDSYNNTGTNASYNPNNNPYSNKEFETRYTVGLSGSGRKWFNRYISKGFSPETARSKALEHRKLPYLRGALKKTPTVNDPTNVALETIGNTIISLLSANPADNNHTGFANSMEGGSIGMPGTSSLAPPQALNAVSRRQYLKSLDILKQIEKKRVKSGEDRISLKYHTQIVKDYQKLNGPRNRSIPSKTTSAKGETPQQHKSVNSARTEEEISELMIKQKAKLLRKAKELGSEKKHKRLPGAYKKRVKILMDHGFLELESKSLAWNPLNTLEELLSLKREYDLFAKKTVFIPASKATLAKAPKSVVYRNDLQYLEEYAKHRIKGLSKTILHGLTECIKRIHAYEKSENLPLTDNKFTKLLLKITSREDFFKRKSKPSPRKRRSVRAAANKDVKESKESESKKEVDKVKKEGDGNATEEAVNEGSQDKQDCEENHDNEDQYDNEVDADIEANEEEFGDNEEFDDAVVVKSDTENSQAAGGEEQNAQE